MINRLSVSALLLTLLAGCTSTYENHGGVLLGEPVSQSMVDAISGYRVHFYTAPPGAKLYCSGVAEKQAPFYQYINLTKDQKNAGILEIEQCVATWQSGAKTQLDVNIPLSEYKKYAYVLLERPADHPNDAMDYAIGSALLQERAKQFAEIQGLTNALTGLATLAVLSKSFGGSISPEAFNIF